MKKRHLILIAGKLFLTPFTGRAQEPPDSLEQQVDQTAIELVYNHYLQDGDNSAVTGGIGTEKLTVYGPAATIQWKKARHSTSLQLGADLISSASTDKIDFVRSSASAHDTRAYGNVALERHLKPDQLSVYGGGGFSIESDYFSLAGKFGMTIKPPRTGRTYQLETSLFWDDLRWGRLDEGVYRPQFLIYPQELRGQDWYDTFRRTSVNLKLGYTQILSNRQVLGIFPELSYQSGLLATPFHRVYFTDGSVGVEQVPGQRFKAALGLRLNSAAGDRIILKHGLDAYADTYDIFGASLRHELSYRVSPFITLGYSLRAYHQDGAHFFRPFFEHEADSRYHTSDYDLSTLQTYSAGLVFKYFPFRLVGKRSTVEAVVFHYRFLRRSNGLEAHIFSVAVSIQQSGRE